MSSIVIAVCSADALLLTGITTLLRDRPDLEVVAADRVGAADLVVVAVDDGEQLPHDLMRRVAYATTARVVLITDRMDPADLPFLVSCRVVSLVSRRGLSIDSLVKALEGGITAPLHSEATRGDLLLRLRQEAAGLGGNQAGAASITMRERALLELLAEGHDTAEIALQLSYSERTVKKIVHQLLSRFELRNRAHAVAFAMRSGAL